MQLAGRITVGKCRESVIKWQNIITVSRSVSRQVPWAKVTSVKRIECQMLGINARELRQRMVENFRGAAGIPG